MAPYLDTDSFKSLTIMPSSDVDNLEAMAPGWLDAKLAARSRWIDARLAKRYATPFGTPVPEAVKDWLARIVTLSAYLRLGVSPTDEQFVEIKADAEKAEAEVAEAANSETGLFDLPLREDSTSSGVDRGGPFVSSYASPYAWTTDQRRRGRDEDRRGGRSES